MLNLAGRVLQDSIWPFGRRWSILPVTGRLSELDLQPEKTTYRMPPSRKSKQHLYTLYHMHTCIYHFHTGMCWLSKYMNKDRDRALHLIHIDMRQAGMELGWFKNVWNMNWDLLLCMHQSHPWSRDSHTKSLDPTLSPWETQKRRLDASSLQVALPKKRLSVTYSQVVYL